MVENVDPPTPTKKRTTSIPAYDRVSPLHSWHITKSIPDTMNTGRRPLTSENGARIIGAIAKPVGWLAPRLVECQPCRFVLTKPPGISNATTNAHTAGKRRDPN